MTEILEILAEEVRDSRKNPTISVTVMTKFGNGTFHVPSGASTGSHEAKELRDKEGHVGPAIERVHGIIRPALVGHHVEKQPEIDRILRELDGTPDKSRLGGNAMIGVSIAAAKAAAATRNIQTYEHLRTLVNFKPSRTTPFLYCNYINGGKHAHSPVAFQEHMLVPDTASVSEAIEMVEKVAQALEEIIRIRYGTVVASQMGDEGGYVIPEHDPRVPFELLLAAIRTSGHADTVKIATDVAASSFYTDGAYKIGNHLFSSGELMELYTELCANFPILSIEDPFFEESFEDFAELQKKIAARVVGDDLTTTNVERLSRAIQLGSISAIIIKPNQIGTLTEVFDTMKLARERGIDCIISHRSGETMDDFIADLAHATGAFGLKAGALRKQERRVKYERLATISA